MEKKKNNKNTPKALKYKIYKQFRSDVWGTFILKKRTNRLTLRLLKNFEYILTRKVLGKFSRKLPFWSRQYLSFFGFSFFRKDFKSGLGF